MQKIHLDDLITKLELVIQRKRDTGNEQKVVDNEVLAYISLYRHGSNEYKKMAKKCLITFLVNAGFVKNKRFISY